MHSATKYLGGHSDLIAGAVVGSRDRVAAVRTLLHRYGPALDPHAAWLLERGIRTLPVRMERHNAQAGALAQWFATQSGVEAVHHLSLPNHPDHALAAALMDGFGGMLGVVLSGGAPAADAFVSDLRVAALAPSLGGVETLVSLPRLTSHRNMAAADRENMGISDGFVRISVGLEGLEDLKADFEAALKRAAR
jgi:cystathionine beta-lyase/cystathionine gamma-synthase